MYGTLSYIHKDLFVPICTRLLNNNVEDTYTLRGGPRSTIAGGGRHQYIYIYIIIYVQRRIEECLGGGLTYCKQGQSPCSKHEVPSGGWLWEGVSPLRQWKKNECRECLDVFEALPNPHLCVICIYIRH